MKRHLRTLLGSAMILAPGLPLHAQTAPAPAPGMIQQPTPTADRLAGAMRRLAANPQDLEALIDAGEASAMLDDGPAALQFMARAERVRASDPRIAAIKGRTLVRLGRPGEALREFASAERSGLSPIAYASDRGLAYDLVGDQPHAQDEYARVLAGGDDAETRRRYAVSLAISGDRAGADRILDPLLRQQDRAAWRTRAIAMALAGDMAGAEKVTLAMMPGFATAYTPLFRRLSQIRDPADRAFAAHLGEFTRTPARMADAQLAPQVTAAPQVAAKPPVVFAANEAEPDDRSQELARRRALAESRRTEGESRSSRRARRDRDEVRAQTAQAAPRAILSRTAEVPAATPAPVASTPPSSAPAAATSSPAATSNSPTTALTQPTPTPTPAASTASAAAPVRTNASAAPIAARTVAAPVAGDSVGREDDRLASIVRNIAIPGIELGDAPPPPPQPVAVPVAVAPTPPPAKKPEPVVTAKAEPKKTPVAKADTRKPAAKKATPKPPSEPARWWVQVAGGANVADLPKSWRAIGEETKALKGRQAWTTPLRFTNRLLTGPFKTGAEAQSFVNNLRKDSVSAFAFQSEEGQKITKLPTK